MDNLKAFSPLIVFSLLGLGGGFLCFFLFSARTLGNGFDLTNMFQMGISVGSMMTPG